MYVWFLHVPLSPSLAQPRKKEILLWAHLRPMCPSGVTMLDKVTHSFCWQLLIFISSALKLGLNYCSTRQTQLAAGRNSKKKRKEKKGVLHRKDKLVIHTDKEWHYKYNDVFGSNPKQSFCVVSYTESTCEESNGCYVSKRWISIQK